MDYFLIAIRAAATPVTDTLRRATHWPPPSYLSMPIINAPEILYFSCHYAHLYARYDMLYWYILPLYYFYFQPPAWLRAAMYCRPAVSMYLYYFHFGHMAIVAGKRRYRRRFRSSPILISA